MYGTIPDNIGSSCVARWITECVWSVIRSGLLVIWMFSVTKTSKLSTCACSLGRGALDRVLPFLYTMVKVYR